MVGDLYNKLLGAVGNAVARENGFPFSKVEYSEELSCQPGLPESSLPLGRAYIQASDDYENLKKRAKAKGVAVDFALGFGRPLIVRTWWGERGAEFGIGKKTVRRMHYFEVAGYRSRKDSLLKNIDGLSDISGLEKTVEPKERPKLAFVLLEDLYKHYNLEELYGKGIDPNGRPERFTMKNSARLLGLDREETYSGMRKLAEGERQAKRESPVLKRLLWWRESRIKRSYRDKLGKISEMEDVFLPKAASR